MCAHEGSELWPHHTTRPLESWMPMVARGRELHQTTVHPPTRHKVREPARGNVRAPKSQLEHMNAGIAMPLPMNGLGKINEKCFQHRRARQSGTCCRRSPVDCRAYAEQFGKEPSKYGAPVAFVVEKAKRKWRNIRGVRGCVRERSSKIQVSNPNLSTSVDHAYVRRAETYPRPW
jgi:hypothetical protein